MLGCDAGFNENKNDNETLKESSKILNEYKKVQGTYEGTLQLSIENRTLPVDIEIRLKPEISYEGRSDGELIPQVSLNGSFRILDFLWPYNEVNFVGRYWYAQDGRIQMSGNTSLNFNEKEKVVWFQAYPKNQALVRGEFWGPQGLVGPFQASLKSKEVRAPGEGSDEDLRKRLKQSYQKLLGVFEGNTYAPQNPEKHRRSLNLRFSFFLQGTSLGAMLEKVNSVGGSARPLEVKEYQPMTGLIIVEGKPLGGVGRVPGYGTFYARGYLRQDRLLFEDITDHYGTLGTYTGTKIQKEGSK